MNSVQRTLFLCESHNALQNTYDHNENETAHLQVSVAREKRKSNKESVQNKWKIGAQMIG